jgi:hypothetical protein
MIAVHASPSEVGFTSFRPVQIVCFTAQGHAKRSFAPATADHPVIPEHQFPFHFVIRTRDKPRAVDHFG